MALILAAITKSLRWNPLILCLWSSETLEEISMPKVVKTEFKTRGLLYGIK